MSDDNQDMNKDTYIRSDSPIYPYKKPPKEDNEMVDPFIDLFSKRERSSSESSDSEISLEKNKKKIKKLSTFQKSYIKIQKKISIKIIIY